MNEHTQRLFDLWKNNCNDTDLTIHHYDSERWMDFVIAASEDEGRPTQAELVDILGADTRLNNENIDEVGKLYQYGLDLLARVNSM